jgi:exodeoxyribonuclease VII small subunit
VATTDPTTTATTQPPDPAIDSLSFDDALAELQRTVAELEAGGQPLEVAIALYERGVALQARCERLIGDAELRVQQLVARAGGALEARDVRPDDEPGAAEGR